MRKIGNLVVCVLVIVSLITVTYLYSSTSFKEDQLQIIREWGE